MQKIVDLVIRGKDATAHAVASTVAGMGRIRTASASTFSIIRANAAAATESIRRGFTERIGQRLFDGLIAGASAFVRGSFAAAAESERGLHSLQDTIQSVGHSYEQVGGKVEATVARLVESSAFDDDEIMAGLESLVRGTQNYRFSVSNLSLVLDVAAKKQWDVGQAATAVEKAYHNNTRALRELGIYVKDGASAMEQMRKMYGGFASEELGTATGAWKTLTREIGEAQEAFAEGILPVVPRIVAILKVLAVWLRENAAALAKWTLVIGIVVGAGGPLLILINLLTSAVGGLTIAFGSLGAALAVGAPVLVGLGLLAAAFIKVKSAALQAAAETRQAKADFVADLGEMDLKALESQRQALQARLAQDQDRINRLADEIVKIEEENPGYKLPTGGTRMGYGFGRGRQEYQAKIRERNAAVAERSATLDRMARVDAEIEFRNSPEGNPTNPPGPTSDKDPIRERIDLLREAAELGILTNAERAEAVRLEEAINGRLQLGIPDLEKRVDAQQKVNDLRDIMRADYENELELLERANEQHRMTPELIARAEASLERLTSAIPTGNAEEQAEHLALIERYHAQLRAPVEAEIEALERAASLRELNADEQARLGVLAERTNDLGILAVAYQQEGVRIAELQLRLMALREATMTREITLLADLRGLRRLTPDEVARVALRRRELEMLIEINRGTAKEVEYRQKLAQLDPNSGGLTRGERNTGPLGMLDTGLSFAGLGQSIRDAVGPIQELEDAIGTGLVDAMYRFGQATGEALGLLLDGSTDVWEAFEDVGREAIAGLSRTLGDHYMAKGAAAIAEGLWPPNPAALAQGAQYFAAGALMYGIAGAVGSHGGGARGGGAGATAAGAQESTNDVKGQSRQVVTVHLKGEGMFNMDDAKQMDGFVNMLNEAQGRGALINFMP